MKSLFTVILATFLTCSCSSDDDSSATPVNLLGSWSYTITIGHPACNGVTAQGVLTITPSSNDVSIIEDYLIQGETLDINNSGNCIVINVNANDTSWRDRPSEQTRAQYLQFAQEDEAGEPDVVSVAIVTFNDSRIVQATELTGGIVVTSELSR